MKTKMLISTFLYIWGHTGIAMALAEGGHDTGNGEFLHACKKGKKSDDYKVLEIWDFYEARKSNPKAFEVNRDWNGTVYEQSIRAIQKIEKVNSSYASLVKREFEFMIQPSPGVPYSDQMGADFLEDLAPNLFQNSWLQLVDGPLAPTNDTDSFIYTDKGQNCEKLQLVNYPEYLDPSLDPATIGLDEKIKIDRKLWKSKKDGIFTDGYLLHKTDKAAVLLHEAIYKVERDLFNAADSKHTRLVIALLFQRNPINFDATLASKLIPSDQTLFTESNFNYESVRKFFHNKGKFSAIEMGDLLNTQWDLYGSLNRDGRNSIEMFYSPEKATAPFALGKRPKLIFMRDGLVFPDSIFQEETCRRTTPQTWQELGCIGRFRINEKGQLGFGQLDSITTEESYSFPSVDCKLSFSRNVLICESLSHSGDTFFTLFYKQNKKADFTKTRGLFRFVTEIYPTTKVLDIAQENPSYLPTIMLATEGASTLNLGVLARGLGYDDLIPNGFGGWVGLSYRVNGNRVTIEMLNTGPWGIDSLDCLINPLQDTLICSPRYTVVGTDSNARLVFQLSR